MKQSILDKHAVRSSELLPVLVAFSLAATTTFAVATDPTSVSRDAVEPRITGIHRSAESSSSKATIHIEFEGSSGSAYEISSTTDFIAWESEGVVVATSGKGEFVDPVESVSRFYRVAIARTQDGAPSIHNVIPSREPETALALVNNENITSWEFRSPRNGVIIADATREGVDLTSNLTAEDDAPDFDDPELASVASGTGAIWDDADTVHVTLETNENITSWGFRSERNGVAVDHPTGEGLDFTSCLTAEDDAPDFDDPEFAPAASGTGAVWDDADIVHVVLECARVVAEGAGQHRGLVKLFFDGVDIDWEEGNTPK